MLQFFFFFFFIFFFCFSSSIIEEIPYACVCCAVAEFKRGELWICTQKTVIVFIAMRNKQHQRAQFCYYERCQWVHYYAKTSFPTYRIHVIELVLVAPHKWRKEDGTDNNNDEIERRKKMEKLQEARTHHIYRCRFDLVAAFGWI